ncbi:hypothetical protein AMAG_00701 [Allomyces macrogynus ATCC 38327]|uniref:FAS1 domain-containing protein n=1 Tax=Allomyces macrogynus (strain ATCC 38327) TaxID=578462 RepID=A0A0L0RWH3_ALLM3|nr:hypothetical protein AMAG_00701 [Allomyces macrogynus ATCC 38327]|eukprot:KNE54742.1 hypothetical protein AMAG_00701 [Allomyces macrogynus ATCC 38327]
MTTAALKTRATAGITTRALVLALFVALLAVTAAAAVLAVPLARRQPPPPRQAPSPPPPPPGVDAFPPNVANLTAWQAVSSNPSLSNFSSLLTAKAPQVVTALNTTGAANVTVFAPTNTAFAPLVNQSLFQYLASNPNYSGVLAQLLSYHAHNGSAIYTADVPANRNITEGTLSPFFNVTLSRGTARPLSAAQTANVTTVWVNDAAVIYGDTAVRDGVVHVIDRVLSPTWYLPPRSA